MPPNHVANFQLLCRLLNPFSAQPFALPDKPDWPSLWRIADETHCLPELHQSIYRLQLENRIPDEMLAGLGEIARMNVLRCTLLREQILEITQALNQASIHPVWLKGAALLLEDEWEKHCRLMNDLDFWLPNVEQHPAALRILDNLGYRVKSKTCDENWQTSHHYAPRMHAQRVATLEVHRHLIRPNCAILLPDEAAQGTIVWKEWQSQTLGTLSLDERICHSFVQCTVMAVPEMFSGLIRLMKVIDLLRLLAMSNKAQLPNRLIDRVRQSPFRTEASAFMTLLQRDFGIENPFDHDQRYCQAVDNVRCHHRHYKRWLRLKSFKPPVNWRSFLSAPKHWPEKLMHRVKMLAGHE